MSGPLLVRALGQVDGVEGERLRVHRRGARIAAPLPRGHVGEAVVVAQGLTFGGLALLAEVAAAGLLAGQRVAHPELAELEEVGDAAGPLEALAHGTVAEDAEVLPELVAQGWDLDRKSTRLNSSH